MRRKSEENESEPEKVRAPASLHHPDEQGALVASALSGGGDDSRRQLERI